MTLLCLPIVPSLVISHGAVSYPAPRQSVDGTLAPWSGAVPPYPIPFDAPNWCAMPDAASSDPRRLSGANGQACFWFNNGCDIGCDRCDGVTGQKIPCCATRFSFNGTGDPPSWGAEGLVVDAAYVAGFDRDAFRPAHVAFPERKATICDPRLRTLNTAAACGSRADFWYNAPWRSPGIAPVTDSCGTAGGVLPGQSSGAAGADYVNTTNAAVGDLGSALPPLRKGQTVWTAGEDVEVAWVQKAWHGGGYSYRLCPAGATLDEQCFQKTPLDFVGNSSLRWGGVGGEQLFFNSSARGWEVAVGTTPAGSMWRKCPLPRGPWNWAKSGPSFEPVCEESDDCKNAHHKAPECLGPDKPCACRCSGDGIGDLPQLEIVDRVAIPRDLPAGDYVLGWRWDCEESTQIWTSCSDVTIIAP